MKNYTNSLLKISSMCSEDLFVTKEHPFYTREFKRINTRAKNKPINYRLFNEPKWKKAKDLNKNCYVGIAINQKAELPQWNGITFKWNDGRKDRHSNRLVEKFSCNDFWWLIGRYIGDGWLRPQGGVVICCKECETLDITTKLSNLDFHYTTIAERTVNKIHIPFKEIGEYCKQFGRGASNKYLTSDILNLPQDKLQSFLMGYWSADGYVDKFGLHKATSVSKTLIYGIGECIAKAYNRPYSIYMSERKKYCVIEGRTVNQKSSYCVSFKLNANKQDQSFYENGYVWCPIRNIVCEDYHGYVYNMEVENDNSYTANNIIVHNCTDISVAGQQKGLSKDSGTRSGLLWEVERLLNVSKANDELPTYLLMENVKNLVGKKFKADFDSWLQFLDSLGYKTYWQVLNAKDYGIPQNRERVFAVSFLDKREYQFPKTVPLILRLKDVLESNVDEKYYLSDDVVNTLNAHLERNKAKGNGFGWKSASKWSD